MVVFFFVFVVFLIVIILNGFLKKCFNGVLEFGWLRFVLEEEEVKISYWCLYDFWMFYYLGYE